MVEGKAGFHKNTHTWQSGSNNEKLGPSGPAAQLPKCSQCHSHRVWKDGTRRTNHGDVQRWLCRDCGYRFSPRNGSENPSKPLKKRSRWSINSATTILSNRQVCELLTEDSKNLAAEKQETPRKWAAGATKPDTATVKGCLTKFIAKQLLTGLKEKTVKGRFNVLMLLHRRGANLFDPISVFKAIDHAKKFNRATRSLREEEWQNATKNKAAQAYKAFCKTFNITIPPEINFNKWKQTTQNLPWIPLEKEVDQLIAGCGHKTACFLQLLKETGARSGEAWNLKWTDMDMTRRIITINRPEKKGMPRQFKVSNKLIAMLNLLHKKSEKVFGDAQLNTFRKNFYLKRKRIARKLQNPRIVRITFHTLRHFYATMEYHRTKSIIHVKEKLGHRSILNTMIYTHLVNFESDDFHVAHAKNLQEEDELVKAGFEFIRFSERDDVAIYRKRK